MDLQQIQTYLDSANPQERMKGIVELRNHQPMVVVPLLKQRMHDQEFMVRSFVAMGLGHKRTDEGFSALLDFLEYETDPNVIAEAANSLSKFGDVALPHLRRIFMEQPHWLVRQSILAVFEDLYAPELLLDCCRMGLMDSELMVQLVAVISLARLANTPQEAEAMVCLQQVAQSANPELRAKVALVLPQFKRVEARQLLRELRQDSDYRVVGAAMESLLQ